MNVSRIGAGLLLAVLGGVGPVANAATVTWKSTVASGAWHTGSNWDTGTQPVQGDTVYVNNGQQIFWGSSFGGLNSTIRDNSHVTIDGGDVVFQGNYGAVIGNGGSGTASSLNVISGAYRMGGNLTIGNDAGGEAGTLNVGANGLFDAGSGTFNFTLRATGVVNSSGTVNDVDHLILLGGVLNVNDGTFNVVQRIDFESGGATGAKVNISGGTLTTNNSLANLELNLGFGNRYFNFLDDGSSGTLILPNVSVEKMNEFLTKGYIRLNSVASPDSFIVSSFGAGGSQVSLVPEPGTSAMGLLAMGLLVRRRRAEQQIGAENPGQRW